jgi:carbonic anhydrase
MSELKPRDIPAQTDNAVVTCMDNRFLKAAREILMNDYEVDIEGSARLALAGSSMAVADGTLIPQIQKSYKLQEINHVWVIDHTDCGGFGKLKAFGGDESKEIEAHFPYMERAKQAIHNVLPQLVVTTFIINLDGEKILPPAPKGQSSG